jgi:hypothetical protein
MYTFWTTVLKNTLSNVCRINAHLRYRGASPFSIFQITTKKYAQSLFLPHAKAWSSFNLLFNKRHTFMLRKMSHDFIVPNKALFSCSQQCRTILFQRKVPGYPWKFAFKFQIYQTTPLCFKKIIICSNL